MYSIVTSVLPRRQNAGLGTPMAALFEARAKCSLEQRTFLVSWFRIVRKAAKKQNWQPEVSWEHGLLDRRTYEQASCDAWTRGLKKP